ncbi:MULTISPECIES: hypothetical protein, partial [unclassified Iodidimonas]|uniref:hypothetical protein n=1 Tax=unclassified Iodidimonas TaxID=2626145 RepID=UPI0024821E8B
AHRKTRTKWCCNGSEFKPDSSGSSPGWRGKDVRHRAASRCASLILLISLEHLDAISLPLRDPTPLEIALGHHWFLVHAGLFMMRLFWHNIHNLLLAGESILIAWGIDDYAKCGSAPAIMAHLNNQGIARPP